MQFYGSPVNRPTLFSSLILKAFEVEGNKSASIFRRKFEDCKNCKVP